MGIMDFIKNTFLDNHEDFNKTHKTERIKDKVNKQRFNNTYETHNAKKTLNPHKELSYTNTSSSRRYTKKSTYKDNIDKGKDYEKFVGKHIESFDFEVDYRGLRMGKKDGGIDLIAKKNNTYVLIQCKNWSKRKVKQKEIRVFVADYYIYLDEHPELKDKKTKAYFYVSNDLYDLGAKKYAEEKDFLELRVLKMEELETA